MTLSGVVSRSDAISVVSASTVAAGGNCGDVARGSSQPAKSSASMAVSESIAFMAG